MPDTVLEIVQPGADSRSLVLLPGCYRIGRSADAELQIPHAAVSRRHALLERRGRCWLLQDQGSTNGLWWRGRRIRELLLHDGDCVSFGPPRQPQVPRLLFHQPGGADRRRCRRGLALLLAGLGGCGLALLLIAALQAPIRGQPALRRGPLLLFDRQGRPLSSSRDRHHRQLGRLQDFAPTLIDALLASEDSRFWWHPGVDPIGTGRALLTNLLGGRVLEGGSTLTQQLARSLYPDQVGQGETLGRKWRELLVALQLEARFSKHDLLLSYLNQVFLGAGWGFEDASRRLFDKPAAALQLEEAALLVGLLPSPNGYDPCLDPRAAVSSRNQVLARMVEAGRLDAARARAARRRPIQLAGGACRPSQRRAQLFYSDQVRRDLERLVGAEVAAEGNFLIDTHLDSGLQDLVERELRQRIEASRSLAVSQGAVVVLDGRSGGILAIAGGRDHRRSQFNRATMALRQPGSTFKLLPYLLAIERGMRPGDPIRCDPLSWRGQHFGSSCSGNLSLRRALAISSNTAALRLARMVGLETVVRKARDLGITTPLNPVPGLALGQSEVTLLELTGAYAAVANDGLWRAPSTIRMLTDGELCAATAAERCRRPSPPAAGRSGGRTGPGTTSLMSARRVMQRSTARTLQDLLRGVVRGGTGRAASLGGEEWGKTGTTNDGRDLWFIGYEPRRGWLIGIWLGNDDNAPSRAGSGLAAGLWAAILRASGPMS
ncbi:MAG: transglycosylase domain-containing protein [Synechococcus sp.]|nr:transglycosylase domain-containing protein [Synechococcus sp.]